MKKIIFLLVVFTISFYAPAQQMVKKLVAYSSAKFDGNSFVPIDSTALTWKGYYPNITTDLINKVSLGYPNLADLNEIRPASLTTDKTFADSVQYTYKWDTIWGHYKKHYRVDITKNSDWKVAEERQMEYDSILQIWLERQKGLFAYDNQKRLVNILGSVSIFKYYGDSCIYDGYGNIVSLIKKARNSATQELDYFSKFDYSYDASGNVSQRVYSKFGLNTRAWTHWNRRLYAYSNGNIAKSIRQQWDDVNKVWMDRDSILWTFNGNSELTQEKTWSMGENGWELHKTEQILYDGNGNIIGDENTTLKDGVIIYQKKLSYTFTNDQCTSTEFAIWDTIANQYNNVTKWDYTYDGEGDCIEAQSRSWEAGSWTTTSNDFDYEYYYNIEPNSTLEVKNESKNECTIFPNPTAQNVNIRWNENGEMITITNAIGRQVYTQKVQSNIHTLTIPIGEWSDGIYFVHLKSGNQITTQKLVVRNK